MSKKYIYTMATVIAVAAVQSGCTTHCCTKRTDSAGISQFEINEPSDSDFEVQLAKLSDLQERKDSLTKQLDKLKLKLADYRNASRDRAARRQAEKAYPKAEHYKGLKAIEKHLKKEVEALRAELAYYHTLLTTDILKPKREN